MRLWLTSIALCLASCTDEPDPDVLIHDAWARPTLKAGQASAGYLWILNNGDTPDRLISARSDVARVSIHQTQISNGVARMRPMPNGVEIPRNESTHLQPNGTHLMLEQPAQPLKVGDRIPIILKFEHAGERKVEMRVTATPPESHEGH